MSSSLSLIGFSPAAHFLEATARQTRINSRRIFNLDSPLRDELGEISNLCRVANWDGHGALAVSQDTLMAVYCLLESFPIGYPPPSIGAEPDGQITLEWYKSPRKTLSVSVDSNGYLHYAALSGPNKLFGSMAFYNEMPQPLLRLISEVFR